MCNHLNIKKLTCLLVILCLMFVNTDIYSYADEQPTRIKLHLTESSSGSGNPDSDYIIEIRVSDEEQLDSGFDTKNEPHATITWKSDNPHVAEVDANGVVTGKSAGETDVVAIWNSHSHRFHIRVISTDILLKISEEKQIKHQFDIQSDPDSSVTWQSANPDIAVVDENGVVTGKSAGETMIVAEFKGIFHHFHIVVLNQVPMYIPHPRVILSFHHQNSELEVKEDQVSISVYNNFTGNYEEISDKIKHRNSLFVINPRGNAPVMIKLIPPSGYNAKKFTYQGLSQGIYLIEGIVLPFDGTKEIENNTIHWTLNQDTIFNVELEKDNESEEPKTLVQEIDDLFEDQTLEKLNNSVKQETLNELKQQLTSISDVQQAIDLADKLAKAENLFESKLERRLEKTIEITTTSVLQVDEGDYINIGVSVSKQQELLSATPPQNSKLSSEVLNYRLEIKKEQTGELKMSLEHCAFSHPVEIKVSYNPLKYPTDKYKLKLCYYDTTTKQWTELSGASFENGIARVSVNHFTDFAVFTEEIKPSDNNTHSDNSNSKPSGGNTSSGGNKTSNDSSLSGISIANSPVSQDQLKDTTPAIPKEITLEETHIRHSFNDIRGHWAEQAIQKLAEKNIINGYKDNTFKPNNKITKAEFITLLIKAFDLQGEQNNPFKDTKTHWAKEMISIAYSNKIINKNASNTFSPDKYITREEMAVMLNNLLKLNNPKNINFKDKKDISSWSMEAISSLNANNIMSGYQNNTFRPKGYSSRAEAVNVIVNSMQVKGR